MAVRRDFWAGRRPSSRFIWALVFTCTAIAAASEHAKAFVYWHDAEGIGRAELDGSRAQPRFVPRTAGPGLVVDRKYLYWGLADPRDAKAYALARTKLNGSGRPDERFVLTAGAPRGVAVTVSHIYWAQDFPTAPASTYPSSIGRADRDGSNVEQNYLSLGTTRITDLAVHGEYLYWSRTDCPRGECGGAIGRARLDRSLTEPSFITTAAYPSGLAVDDEHIYWTNRVGDSSGNASYSLAGASSIGRADLDGSNVEQQFIGGASYPFDVAVGETRVYWANWSFSPADDGAIGSALLDGTDSDQALVDANVPYALATDARSTIRVACWNQFFPFESEPPQFREAPRKCLWYRRKADTYAGGALLGRKLDWVWGENRATAVGRLKVPGTGQDFGDGRVRLSRPVNSCGRIVYSKLRYRIGRGAERIAGAYPIYTCRSSA